MRHTLSQRWGHKTRGSQSRPGWTRVATCNVTVSLSRDCCYSGHRSRSQVTSHRSLSRRESVTTRAGAGDSGAREERPRERGLCGPGLLHYTPASSSCSSVHFAPNNVAKVSSEPDPDRPQLPGPGNHLRLSGIACIILATVAPWSINQKWQEMVNVAFVAEENRNTCQCLM